MITKRVQFLVIFLIICHFPLIIILLNMFNSIQNIQIVGEHLCEKYSIDIYSNIDSKLYAFFEKKNRYVLSYSFEEKTKYLVILFSIEKPINISFINQLNLQIKSLTSNSELIDIGLKIRNGNEFLWWKSTIMAFNDKNMVLPFSNLSYDFFDPGNISNIIQEKDTKFQLDKIKTNNLFVTEIKIQPHSGFIRKSTFEINKLFFNFSLKNYIYSNHFINILVSYVFLVAFVIVLISYINYKSRKKQNTLHLYLNLSEAQKKIFFASNITKNKNDNLIIFNQLEMSLLFYDFQMGKSYLKKYLEIFSIAELVEQFEKKNPKQVKFIVHQLDNIIFIKWYKKLLLYLINYIIEIIINQMQTKIDIKLLRIKKNILCINIEFKNTNGLTIVNKELYNILKLAELYFTKSSISNHEKKTIIHLHMKVKTIESPILVRMKNNKFIPYFKKVDVSRDSFIHLRQQLIQLGCPQDQVISIAQKITMDVLDVDFDKYMVYLLDKTYNSCMDAISNGYSLFPLQDPSHPLYSHIELFSSIYGFEIDYLKLYYKKDTKIADIGCGEGLLLKIIAYLLDINADGFDIYDPKHKHDVNLTQIKKITDIKPIYNCIILNHVIEHIQEKPSVYINKLINHFNSGSTKLQSIIISLPIHKSIPSHLSANHKWMFYNEENFQNMGKHSSNSMNGLILCNFAKEIEPIINSYAYELIVVPSIGVYVIQKI